ncbi:ABC transporter permease [Nocardioides limicola]|uniref:ABC transporter permease n=1 Tax=Nocardioides limicola TaxID=2803368 RepID=UPI00193C1972|nr:ABC transporter permease [Nocardioides sp. DJM-14]
MSSPSVRSTVVRAGVRRGLLETKHSLTNAGELAWYLLMPAIFAAVLVFMRDSTVPGTDFALGAMVLPGLIGMSIAMGGLLGAPSIIAAEREDGTLLRAKATPHGMPAYLIAKIVTLTLTTLITLLLLVFPALLVIEHLRFGEARSWAILAAIFALGMLTTVPIGAAIGAMLKSTAQFGWIWLSSMFFVGVSGIFYPLTALPLWLQWVGQALPFYWLGLGSRAALLPAEMAVVEIGESWRTVEMLGVLGVWAVLGFVLAPVLLRRMARRESGSSVAARREEFLTRSY